MTFKRYLASPVMVIGTINIILCVGGMIGIALTVPLLLLPVAPAIIMMLCINIMGMIKECQKLMRYKERYES